VKQSKYESVEIFWEKMRLKELDRLELPASADMHVHLRQGRLIYIYYIHPELRIGDFRFRSGKGARPLEREQRGSRGEHQGSKGEQGGAPREHRGSTEGAGREHEGSMGAQHREPELAALHPAIAAHV